MIAQAQGMVRSDSGCFESGPKRRTLQTKTELLNKLDEEVIEMVDEDALEEEIKQADITREQIELAIIDLNRVLDDVARTKNTSAGHTQTP